MIWAGHRVLYIFTHASNELSLYYEIETAVRALREATEDAREQAPINTFVNVLFSAF